jgi:hypothetical protein
MDDCRRWTRSTKLDSAYGLPNMLSLFHGKGFLCYRTNGDDTMPTLCSSDSLKDTSTTYCHCIHSQPTSRQDSAESGTLNPHMSRHSPLPAACPGGQGQTLRTWGIGHPPVVAPALLTSQPRTSLS